MYLCNAMVLWDSKAFEWGQPSEIGCGKVDFWIKSTILIITRGIWSKKDFIRKKNVQILEKSGSFLDFSSNWTCFLLFHSKKEVSKTPSFRDLYSPLLVLVTGQKMPLFFNFWGKNWPKLANLPISPGVPRENEKIAIFKAVFCGHFFWPARNGGRFWGGQPQNHEKQHFS